MATCVLLNIVFDLFLEILFICHQQTGCLLVERIFGVWIKQKLRKKNFEDVEEVKHGRPCLVYYVKANRARPIIENIKKQGITTYISSILGW